MITGELEPPLQCQEIWASGVTYYNSKLGREEESKESGAVISTPGYLMQNARSFF